MIWSDMTMTQKIEAIRGGLLGGITQRRIAMMLGATPGAVAGFIHGHPETRAAGPVLVGFGAGAAIVRVRMAGAPKPVTAAVRPEPAPEPVPAPVPIAPPKPAPARPVGHLSIMEIRDGCCRWPMWGEERHAPPETRLMCSAPCPIEQPYCETHAAAARRRPATNEEA